MSQPPNYNRSKDFTENLPGTTDHAALNSEFDNASFSINHLCSRLALIQGGDGRLLPDSITVDSIRDNVIDYLAAGIRLEMQADFQGASDAATMAGAAASAAADAAAQAADSATLAGQYGQDVLQNRETVQALADAADASAALSANSALLAGQHKESAALYKYQAQLESESAAASALTAVNSASQTSLYKEETLKARDAAREWAESASYSASQAASSAETAANNVTQIAQLVREALHILEDVRASAVSAAASACTAASSSTAASGSASAALAAAQSSGAHVMAAIAGKDAAAASAYDAAASAHDAAASAAAAAAGAAAAGESVQASRPGAMSATAGGTPDVITACFKGGVSEPPQDHVVMYVRAIGTNQTTTPTFKPGSAHARVIVKGNNLPLAAGDIAGSGFGMLLQYNAEYDRFVLLNPASGVFGNDSFPVGAFAWVPPNTPGYIDLAYDSITSVMADTYPGLVDARYCGDANNAAAGWFYRADDMAGNERNINGAYFILPGLKDYFLRPGQEDWVMHEDQMQRITGSFVGVLSSAWAPTHSATGATAKEIYIDRIGGSGLAAGQASYSNYTFDSASSPNARTGNETVPKHIRTNIAIKAYDVAANQEQIDIAYLLNKVQAFEANDNAHSTILYPNNGTATSPANVTINQRIAMDNPYPGYYVHCEVQVQINGKWGIAGWIYDSSIARAYGVVATQYDDGIVVQTGRGYVTGGGSDNGHPHPGVGATATAPCRVIVTRLGKIQ